MIEEFYRRYLGISHPYSHQKEMWNRIIEGKFPLIVKAPTGSGKTEGVIAPFLYQFVENDFFIAPRLIYVLPMRALVNSIAKRIGEYAEKVSNEMLVEIQHGELPNDPFFMDDIVVTTLDQFIYAYARASRQVGHHLDIPAGAIASSLVVFDEAHMYRDGFTFSIMRAIFEILYHARIPFVVMTATMPESLSLEKREGSLFENLETAKIECDDFNLNNQLDIFIKNEPIYKDNEVNISDDILDRIKDKKTLIVLNQVKRAQKVYEMIKDRLDLEGGKEIVLLHSRFTRKDRKEHEEEALSILPHKEAGKVVIPDGRGVVVSTQVLEGGMDFSAELLLTELAPADAVVQRAGRCARYENEKGEMMIFPVEEKKGYLPYEEEHLKKTRRWLNKNRTCNIRNFSEASRFVNILNYKADDYAAIDSLIDLYECVLYADTIPKNIQVRKSKPVTLIVVDFGIGEGEKQEDKIKDAIGKTDIKDNSINVDIRIAWDLFSAKRIRWELSWKYNEKEKRHEIDIHDLLKRNKNVTEEDPRIAPFRTYIIESTYYDQLKGVVPDETFIIKS